MTPAHGRSQRSRHIAPTLESLEGRQLLTQYVFGSGVSSVFEFASATNRTVLESAGKLTFIVSRSGDLSSPATVKVKTVGGTALEGLDYTAYQSTLTFAAGQASTTFTVSVINDQVAEAPIKSFTVQLYDPSAGAIVGPPTAGLAGASTSLVYIVDDEPASGQPLSFFDYGKSGIWSYDTVQGFQKIAGVDPQSVVGSANRMAYVDMGSSGLWAWDSLRGLRQISAMDPEQVVVFNTSTYTEDVVVADFGDKGLWRYSESKGWKQLSDVDPQSITVDPQTLDVYVAFTRNGLWRYNDAKPWLKIADVYPRSMAADAGVLYLNEGLDGLWSWSVAGGLKQINAAMPSSIAAGGGVLYVEYNGFGLWTYRPASGLKLLGGVDPQSMAYAGGTLYLDYGAKGGLWTYTASTGFQQASSSTNQTLLVNPATGLVFVDAGAGGLWAWTSTGYRRINTSSPAVASALA